MRAGDSLAKAAETWKERNALYGNTYHEFGHIMAGLFPKGLHCSTIEDFNRLGVFVHCVDKLSRYAANLVNGGHEDSALDLSVYAAMLRELTDEKQGVDNG